MSSRFSADTRQALNPDSKEESRSAGLYLLPQQLWSPMPYFTGAMRIRAMCECLGGCFCVL